MIEVIILIGGIAIGMILGFCWGYENRANKVDFSSANKEGDGE